MAISQFLAVLEEASIFDTLCASAFWPSEMSDNMARSVPCCSCVEELEVCAISRGLLAVAWCSEVALMVGNRKDSPICTFAFEDLVATLCNRPVDEALTDFFAFLAVGVVLGGILSDKSQ